MKFGCEWYSDLGLKSYRTTSVPEVQKLTFTEINAKAIAHKKKKSNVESQNIKVQEHTSKEITLLNLHLK